MRVTQDIAFRPVTITLESSVEVRDLADIVVHYIHTNPSQTSRKDDMAITIHNALKDLKV
jgi:hypothetical protein